MAEIFNRGLVAQEKEQVGRYGSQIVVGAQLTGSSEEVDQHFFGHEGGFVQVHLPVHEATRNQKFFNGVDAFGFHHQLIVGYAKHFDDAVGTHDPFGYAGKKAVAQQIIEAVHVELTADQLMEKFFWVAVGENIDGHLQATSKVLVESFHKQQGDGLVVNAPHEGRFQHMGKGTMAQIVHQYGGVNGLCLVGTDVLSLGPQGLHGLRHQVHAAQGVLKAGMGGTRIYEWRHAQLLDPAQALQVGVFDEVEKQFARYVDEAVDRVVDDFLFINGFQIGTSFNEILSCRCKVKFFCQELSFLPQMRQKLASGAWWGSPQWVHFLSSSVASLKVRDISTETMPVGMARRSTMPKKLKMYLRGLGEQNMRKRYSALKSRVMNHSPASSSKP